MDTEKGLTECQNTTRADWNCGDREKDAAMVARSVWGARCCCEVAVIRPAYCRRKVKTDYGEPVAGHGEYTIDIKERLLLLSETEQESKRNTRSVYTVLQTVFHAFKPSPTGALWRPSAMTGKRNLFTLNEDVIASKFISMPQLYAQYNQGLSQFTNNGSLFSNSGQTWTACEAMPYGTIREQLNDPMRLEKKTLWQKHCLEVAISGHNIPTKNTLMG